MSRSNDNQYDASFTKLYPFFSFFFKINLNVFCVVFEMKIYDDTHDLLKIVNKRCLNFKIALFTCRKVKSKEKYFSDVCYYNSWKFKNLILA